MTIHAISLTQPYASLIMAGAKKIETRSWGTGLRGTLAICAAASFPGWARNITWTEPFASALAPVRFGGMKRMNGVRFIDGLPVGALLGLVELRDCRKFESYSDLVLSPNEEAFGQYGAGRWLWMVKDARPYQYPVPVKGSLGLFPLDLPGNVRLEPARG